MHLQPLCLFPSAVYPVVLTLTVGASSAVRGLMNRTVLSLRRSASLQPVTGRRKVLFMVVAARASTLRCAVPALTAPQQLGPVVNATQPLRAWSAGRAVPGGAEVVLPVCAELLRPPDAHAAGGDGARVPWRPKCALNPPSAAQVSCGREVCAPALVEVWWSGNDAKAPDLSLNFMGCRAALYCAAYGGGAVVSHPL